MLPISKAEELLATLPGVISVRIVAGSTGSVDEIHLLTSDTVPPKATVRNVESALMAQLGMRVSHKKISVATTRDTGPRSSGEVPRVREAEQAADFRRRRLYFEDIEVRRSRTQGVTCRVTLKKGESSFVGETEGLESERLRIELAARAALLAIGQSESDVGGVLGLEGCKLINAFDHDFVFVGITARFERETVLLTGTAEVKESAETAAVLAVLDATNRWVEYSER
ncbi:MAG TPA: hypothetical protein VMV51_05470 [Gemmatimonadaceae bacterium]|nr:hypothetical protein [Gemmatimonadaceae bacterium]